MNYTPERADGSVDISKALEVNVEFDLSRQFWSYLVRKGAIDDPRSFMVSVYDWLGFAQETLITAL